MDSVKTHGIVNGPLPWGGLLAFLAGFIILMGIITGEIHYPEAYNTRVNDISDLGSTRPPNPIIHEPSATIFNSTMLIAGLLLVVSNVFVFRQFRKWAFTIPFILFALGIVGVGVFPGNITPYHGLSSMTTFVMGSLTCIASYSIIAKPFGWIGIPIGVSSLIFLFGANMFIPSLGSGGTERWVAYPIVIWLIGFGGYLLGTHSIHKKQAA